MSRTRSLASTLGNPATSKMYFSGIERHELAAERGKRVDDPRRGAAHARVEGREEAGGPSADDRDVLQVLLCHVRSCGGRRGFRDKRWNV